MLLRFKFLQKRTIVIKNYHTVTQHILCYMLLNNCQITMVLILLFHRLCIPLHDPFQDLHHQIHALYRNMLTGTMGCIAASAKIGAGKTHVRQPCPVCAATDGYCYR